MRGHADDGVDPGVDTSRRPQRVYNAEEEQRACRDTDPRHPIIEQNEFRENVVDAPTGNATVHSNAVASVPMRDVVGVPLTGKAIM
jgi:hypothetical protein